MGNLRHNQSLQPTRSASGHYFSKPACRRAAELNTLGGIGKRQDWIFVARATRNEVKKMMRMLVVTVTLLLFSSLAFAEVLPLEPTQNPDAPYRLFNTKNIYTLLRLDTREGGIWQVQWGDRDHRFIVPINLKALASDGKPGRFTLYPTGNIHTFLLLDQETGDTWQVQWGGVGERFIEPIE